jgi:hypothetical protein
MKASFSPIIVLAALLSSSAFAVAQAFLNLDFENPVPPLDPNDPSGVPIANALPGWSGYTYDVMVSRVWYNTLSLGAAAISLHDTASSLRPIYQGNYTVVLQGSTASTPSSAVIGQTGLLPAGAQSLIFWGVFAGQVTFNGQNVSYFVIGAGPNYTIYGGNIGAFAGQTGELRFSTPPNTGGAIDNIQFSNQPIPEPSALGLLGLGALLLGGRFLWRNKRPT